LAKVNLLRPEIGAVSAGFMPKLSFGKLQKFLFLLSAIAFLSGILIIMHTWFQKKQLYYISSEYKEAEKLKKGIGISHQEKDKLAKEIELLSSYLKRDVYWSAKLDQMRNVIPREVWLRKFAFEQKIGKDKDFSLALGGSFIPRPDVSSIAMLSNFINKLKENKDFFEGFDNPILSDVRSEPKDNVEIMSFTIEIPVSRKDTKLPREANK
jgi:hypothetical protein